MAFTRRHLLRATSAIVTTGEALRAQLVNDNGYPSSRIHSVPTGIDSTRFVPGDKRARRNELGLPADALIVGIIEIGRAHV